MKKLAFAEEQQSQKGIISHHHRNPVITQLTKKGKVFLTFIQDLLMWRVHERMEDGQHQQQSSLVALQNLEDRIVTSNPHVHLISMKLLNY